MYDAGFEGARLSDCILEGDGEYRIVIRPENKPVNNSAWYAFRVSAKTPQTLIIHLTYEGGKHRYHPKISTDGITWRRLSGDRYQRKEGTTKEGTVTLQVDVGPDALWIAAQEMIGLAELNAWMDRIARRPFVGEAATTPIGN